MIRFVPMKELIALAVIATDAAAERRQGSPLNHLPKNIEVLTGFGERADISPDNSRIAFMAKSFGDAFRSHCRRSLFLR